MVTGGFKGIHKIHENIFNIFTSIVIFIRISRDMIHKPVLGSFLGHPGLFTVFGPIPRGPTTQGLIISHFFIPKIKQGGWASNVYNLCEALGLISIFLEMKFKKKNSFFIGAFLRAFLKVFCAC